MAKIKVYQAKEENMETVKNIIDVEEQNPTAENLQSLYACVLDTEIWHCLNHTLKKIS